MWFITLLSPLSFNMARPTNKDLAVYASILIGFFALVQQYLALQQAKVEAGRLRRESEVHERALQTVNGRNYREWATNAIVTVKH